MQCVIVLFAVTLLVTLSKCEQKNDSRTENIDVEMILKNDRLVKNYVDCLLDKGRCTKEGLELKSTIPDALETNCSKCSEKQKVSIRRVISYLQQNKPDWWKELLEKYDPSGTYTKKFGGAEMKEAMPGQEKEKDKH